MTRGPASTPQPRRACWQTPVRRQDIAHGRALVSTCHSLPYLVIPTPVGASPSSFATSASIEAAKSAGQGHTNASGPTSMVDSFSVNSALSVVRGNVTPTSRASANRMASTLTCRTRFVMWGTRNRSPSCSQAHHVARGGRRAYARHANTGTVPAPNGTVPRHQTNARREACPERGPHNARAAIPSRVRSAGP